MNQNRHLLIELFRQEVQISLAGLGFLPTPEQIMLCQHVVREEHVNKEEASGAPKFSSRPEANTNTRCRCDKCQGRNQRSHHRQDTHEREQQTGEQLLIPYLLQTNDNEPCGSRLPPPENPPQHTSALQCVPLDTP